MKSGLVLLLLILQGLEIKMSEQKTLIEVISGLNAIVQAEDKKIQEQVMEGQKAYQAALEAAKAVVTDPVIAYELGRFASNPQQYQLPPESEQKSVPKFEPVIP